jgi:hypothetical protein
VLKRSLGILSAFIRSMTLAKQYWRDSDRKFVDYADGTPQSMTLTNREEVK